MLQDGVPLETQLLRTDGNGHLDVVHLPLCPSTPIHPDTAVTHPFLILHLVDSRQDRIQADLMRAMRIGQVTRHEHLIGLHLQQQRFDDLLVGLTQWILLH